ncbi:MAG: tetratricopeptide repeat protein [bacterium]|nr:tetratricopeptide repeat protein [bacterium]
MPADGSDSSAPPIPAPPTEPAVKLPTWRAALQTLPLAAIWIATIAPLLLWLLARQDPELAVRIKQVTTTAAIRGGLGLALVASVGALLFPPVPAWVRLMFERLRLSFASDRGPLLKALAELEHFASAARHLEVGRLALTRSELPLAAEHLHRAVELDPSIAGAHHQFGILLRRLGHLQQAAVAFQNAEHLDPGHAFGAALLELGRCALLAGDERAAAEILERHRKEHGGSKQSHYWLGKARAAIGEHDSAIAAMKYAAEPTKQRLTPEENWFRALARVWLWRGGRR